MAGLRFNFRSELVQVLTGERTVKDIGNTVIGRVIREEPRYAVQMLSEEWNDQDGRVGTLALVLFRSQILESRVWMHIEEEEKSMVKTSIERLVSTTQDQSRIHQAALCLLSMSEFDHWTPELLSTLDTWLHTSQSRVSALVILEEALECSRIRSDLIPLASNFISVVQILLEDKELLVQLAAAKCAAVFFTVLATDEESLALGKDSVAEILTVVHNCLQVNQTQELPSLLMNLATLTETQPKIWEKCSDSMCKVMVTLAKSRFFDDNLRIIAVELLCAWVQSDPVTVNSQVQFVQELLALAFVLISERTESGQETFDGLYEIGCDFMSLICVNLGAEVVFSHVQYLVAMHLRAESWVQLHTALLVIGLSAEGCHNEYQTSMKDILEILENHSHSDSDRVVSVVYQVVEMLCYEYQPTLQLTHHKSLLSLIQSGFMGSLIVQKRALKSLNAFIQGFLSQEDFNVNYFFPYSAGILETLSRFMNTGVDNNDQELLLSTIEAVSLVSSLLKTGFLPYFPHFISILRSLIQSAGLLPNSQTLRAQAIHAVGVVYGNVSEEQSLQSSAEECLIHFAQLSDLMDDDDPGQFAIDDSYQHFSSILKDRFAPYLEHTLMKLLNKINVEWEEVQDSTCTRGETFLEQKKSRAIEALYGLVGCYQSRYSDFAHMTVKALVPVFANRSSLRLQKYSFKIVALCVALSNPAVQREALLRVVMPEFVRALGSNPESCKHTKWVLQGMLQILKSVELPGVIGLPTATECSGALAQCLSTALNHRYKEAIYSKLITYIAEVVKELLRGFRKEYHSTFKQYFLTFFDYILKTPSNSFEILSVICVFVAYLEHTGDFMCVNSQVLIVEKFLSCFSFSDPSIQIASVLGLTLCAEMCPKVVFKRYILDCLNECDRLRKCEDYRTQFCAIGALGTLAMFHEPGKKGEWVQLLPLKSNLPEARAVNKLFLRAIPELYDLKEQVSRVLSELRLYPDALEPEDQETLRNIAV